MAAQASLVLGNGASTPVNKTFTPVNGYGGAKQSAVWTLKEGVSPMAHVRIEVGMARNGNGTTRVGYKIIVPYVTNSPTTGPTLISKCIFDSAGGGYIIPENATQDQINDLEAFTRNLVQNTAFKDWVKSFEAAY